MKISKAEVRHHSRIIQLLKENNLPVRDIDFNTGSFYVYTEAENIIAVGGTEEYDGCILLRSVAVKDGDKGKGTGKNFMEALLKQIGNQTIYLLTEGASGFFEKLGFTVTDRKEVPDAIKTSSQFADICPSSAVVMKKN